MVDGRVVHIEGDRLLSKPWYGVISRHWHDDDHVLLLADFNFITSGICGVFSNHISTIIAGGKRIFH